MSESRFRDFGEPTTPTIVGEEYQGPVTLEDVLYSDFEELNALRKKNMEYIDPWLATPKNPSAENHLFKIKVLGQLVGTVGIFSIDRKGFPSKASISYWVDENYTNKNVGTIAVMLASKWATQTQDIDVLEAAIQPDNEASIRVVEKAGYERMGLAKKYLKVNGIPTDHLLFFYRDPIADV